MDDHVKMIRARRVAEHDVPARKTNGRRAARPRGKSDDQQSCC
jgi:hypothetical protein